MAKEKVVLIDGSSYFFRAYFAIQHLSNSKGLPTNATYGFINMLLRVIETEKPSRLAICFDTPKATFRKEIYEDYKANRDVPPEDLVVQIPYIQKAVDGFGIYRVQKEGFEADDLIATLSKRAVEKGFNVEIISGDKDLMQLVSRKVTLYDTMKEKRYDEEGVFEKFQVKPTQMIDFLALMGDSSDNVPGVSGIGKKTAAELLQEFGSLDQLYQKLNKIKQQKRREKLEAERDQAYLSQRLVKLEADVPVEFSWDDLKYTGPKADQLAPLLKELEFKNILKRLGLDAAAETGFKPGKYKAVVTETDLEKVIRGIQREKEVCLDTETTSLRTQDAELVGISLSFKEGDAYYIPVGHDLNAEGADEQLEADCVRKHLKPILEDRTIGKIGQNLKYDIQVLRRWGIEVAGIAADTLLASYLVDPEQKHDLDSLAFRYLGHQNMTFEEVAGKGKSQKLFSEVDIPKATHYAAEDADVTFRLYQRLSRDLEEGGLEDLYDDIEIPLIEVLADMEYTGIGVDQKQLKKMSSQLADDITLREEKIHLLAGAPFNINSPKQLSQILFEKLGLTPLRKTKTGFSTDERVLRELSSQHEIAEWIVQFRELSKLKSTYVDGLLSEVHPRTGRVHSSFNQTVAATGRLSSSHPNMQNIPVRGESEYDIRSVFVPSPGHQFLACDYSQVELRLLAHMSEDKELLRAFENDEDVHAHTARLIFGVKNVSQEHRKIAKTINFGVVYGQTPYGLSQQLKIPMNEAKAFIDQYFERYPGVRALMESNIELAREAGSVSTLWGRRRFLPEIRSKNRIRREMAERTAINTPLQGTAADMIKKAMVAIWHQLADAQLKSRMLLQVHDELVLEVAKGEETQVESIVVGEMENALDLAIPLKVDVGWGRNWNECK